MNNSKSIVAVLVCKGELNKLEAVDKLVKELWI
jgi:hypothetical protein